MADSFIQIEGFPDYKINRNGDVISKRKGVIRRLKPSEDKNGYLFVILYDPDGNPHTKKIHRLLAETFIDNKFDYPIVRHLDDNKQNNELSNLKWGTHKHNSEDMIRNNHSTRKRIYCYETDTIYPSMKIASEQLNVSRSDITECANGHISHTKGYHFSYEDDIDINKELTFKQRPHRHGRIIATNVITYEEHVFNSQKDAADKLGLHAANVSMCLSGVRKACKHWKFRYYDEEE